MKPQSPPNIIQLTAASVLSLSTFGAAHAALLLHEPFAYTTGTASGPTLNGVQLQGQSGGTGMTGSWNAFVNNGAATHAITVYPGASNSGVNLNLRAQ